MTPRLILTKAIIEIGTFSFFLNLLVLAQPLYLLQVYDRVLTAASLPTLLYISLLCAIALILLGVLESVRSMYASRIAGQLDAALGTPALMAALSGANPAGGEIQPVRDLVAIRNFIASKVVFFLFDLPFIPVFLVILYFVHPLLFWLTCVGAALIALVLAANQLATKGRTADAFRLNNESMGLAQAAARESETVRAMGMGPNMAEYWGARMADAANNNDALQRTNAVFSGISRVLRLFLQIAILGVGAWLVLEGEMTAGMIFAASIISGRALQPFDQIIGAWRPVQESWAAWKRLRKVSMPMSPDTNATDLPAPAGEISFERVTYFPPGSRPGDDPVIKGISFRLFAGECVAVIGPSRAGKSTLLRIMSGAIRPSNGTVRYDNADIAHWDDAARGRHVGYLAQDVEFLPGSVAMNIARFDPNATTEAVMEAAQKAGAHAVFMAQSRNYETLIGPGGVRLSGGEAQLTGLARALYGNPRILILDEPNASLDNDGDQALDAAIAAAKTDGTTIVFTTHRPHLLRFADRILVMKNGQIDLFGPAHDVMEKLRQRQAAPAAQTMAKGPAPAANTQEANARPQASLTSIGARMAGWRASVGNGQSSLGSKPGSDQKDNTDGAASDPESDSKEEHNR